MSYSDRDPGPIPDRWLKCPRKCVKIIADKFFAFKTPLNNKYDEQVGAAYRWDPAMVFDNSKSLKVRIGIWIDLTNTSRFYDKEEVISGYGDGKEVTYYKLQCRGHGEAPSAEQTQKFIDICDYFVRNMPLDIIGVHCTHGFNRTGFLIVSYLVEKRDLSVACALQEFAKCRPPGIYKGDYIKELYRRYDDIEDAPDPPIKPTWCLENQDDYVQQNGNVDDKGEEAEDVKVERHHGKKRKNNFGRDSGNNRRKMKRPQFMEGVSGVSLVTDSQEVKRLQRLAQDMCGWTGRGFPGCQPVSMDLNNINYLKEHPYRVSWKADGTRYMMLIVGEDEVYFLDRDNNVFHVTGLRFVFRKNLCQHLEKTLLDGEMVIDKHEGKDIPRYLIYDVIRVNNIDVSIFPFHPHRLDCIEADIIRPRHRAITEGKIDRTAEPFSVRSKTFAPIEKARSFLGEKFNQQLTHEPDGLIFQPVSDPYTPGPCPTVLKWKPASHNSVDFRLKIVIEDGLGILKRKVGYLYVGELTEPFAKMKYSSAIKNYHDKIVECKFENNNWVFMRERTDKSFPNVYSTAMSVCESIQNPVTREYLFHIIDTERYRDDVELMPPPKDRFKR